MTLHDKPFHGAGDTFTLPDGRAFIAEDYWDRVSGHSWQHATGNPAALKYAIRVIHEGLPIDDECVYGKCGLGDIFHVTELKEPE